MEFNEETNGAVLLVSEMCQVRCCENREKEDEWWALSRVLVISYGWGSSLLTIAFKSMKVPLSTKFEDKGSGFLAARVEEPHA